MSKEPRILFVEDNLQDVELEIHELRKGGLTFTHQHVDAEEAFRRAIAELKPDLIISDYSMPHMGGNKTLKIAQELCPRVPFIFVSGTIGEERAVESLKNGATDYVVKERLGGLYLKVRRALQEAEDRAARNLLEEQLRQSQKVEALGRLSGGVAHDFNNLLTVITGYTELTLQSIHEKDPLRGNLEEVAQAARRAAQLTGQLLAFGRKQIISPRVIDLNPVLSNMEKMLRRLIGEHIELVTYLHPDLKRIRVDPSQIEQVIVNLAVNARDAMPQGGKLTIESQDAVLDEAYARAHVAVTPGPYVMLSVSDTGVGMDEETRSHLFEPFFTTKEQGKGTGLGLATVHGIVKQSGGHLWVYSEPGRGATFKVYFPQVHEPASRVTPERPSTGTIAGSETLLLVEDETAVRRLAALVLRENGYTVLEAANGGEALLLCEKHPGSIHLMITDVVMPQMGGKDLAQRLGALHPDLKVLYISGYTANAIVHHGVLDAGVCFLPKPFTSQALLRKVRDVLDSPLRA